MYPALAVLQALRNKVQRPGSLLELETLWVGGKGGMEAELVEREAINFAGISAAGVHGVGLRHLPGNALQLTRGYRQSRQILANYHPQALFFTGGYIAVPMALAGRRYASLAFVPDIEPGRALKTIARYATVIAVSSEESRAYFRESAKVIVTGYPTRTDLLEWDFASARQALALHPDLPTLLVFGGSKGARSINRALNLHLADLLTEMQVVHISGQLAWAEVSQSKDELPPDLSINYHPHPYLHRRMGAALRTADLVVARAGASTLGEFPMFGLPAILVPYPHAWQYQRVNADYLARRGAAVVIEDHALGDQLLAQVQALMQNPERLTRMGSAMAALAKPEAASQIAELIIDLAAYPPGKGRIL